MVGGDQQYFSPGSWTVSTSGAVCADGRVPGLRSKRAGWVKRAHIHTGDSCVVLSLCDFNVNLLVVNGCCAARVFRVLDHFKRCGAVATIPCVRAGT